MRCPDRERPNGGHPPSGTLDDVRPDPLVLLDLDGTLIDSIPGITASLRRRVPRGRPARPVGRRAPLVRRAADRRQLAAGTASPPTARGGRAGVPRGLRRGGMHDATVFDGVPDAARRPAGSRVRLLVATSKPEVFAVPICAALGLTPLLDGVFGAPLDESGTKADVIARALRRRAAAAPGRR